VSSGILVHSALVIQALVFFLLSVAPHPVLGFLTGLCPVGFAGRIHKSIVTLRFVAF